MSNRTIADVLHDHLGLEGEELKRQIERMMIIQSESAPFVFDGSQDRERLVGISNAISKLEAAFRAPRSEAAEVMLDTHIAFGPYADGLAEKNQFRLIHLDLDEKASEYNKEHGQPARKALNDLEVFAANLKQAARNAGREIERSARKRRGLSRMNLEELQTVEAARRIWESVRGKPQRLKSLNEAGAFGKFLADVFDVCGLEGNPKSAVRVWKNTRNQEK